MAVQKQDDQHEHTFSSYVRIRDVVLKTRAMNDREEWREKVRDIRATSAIWWWWWYVSQGSQTPPCNIYIYIYIFRIVCKWKSFTNSSSSHHAISTDIPDPLSPTLPIVHCFWQVFRAKSHIGTELLYVGSSWLSCLCSSMWRGPQEYITYKLIPTSPAVSDMFGSSNFDISLTCERNFIDKQQKLVTFLVRKFYQ